ncbi:MAG: HD domain-containing protein [Planctomycetaceae bacterium]
MAATFENGLFAPLLERALRFASRAHRDQVRKSSDVPYLSHPLAVAVILSRAGFDDDHVLAAALLHDVVEDTPVSLNRLAAEFPDDVVQIVDALSEKKTDAGGAPRPWKDRKTEHVARIGTATTEAKAVALADKLHNLRSMLLDYDACGESLWDRFNADKRQIEWYHEAVLAATAVDDERIARLQAECRELLERLAGASAG